MKVNSVQSMTANQPIRQIIPNGPGSGPQGMGSPLGNEFSAGSVHISPMGQFSQIRKEMIEKGISDETLTEMKNFGKQVHEALQNGSYNAADLVENAPEGLKNQAQNMGIDLESALNDLSTEFNNHKMGFGGPGFWGPPPMGENDNHGAHLMRELFGGGMSPMGQLSQVKRGMMEKGMSDERLTEMKNFSKQVHEGLKDGSFDAAALSGIAPEGLKNQAQDMGIDLESALKDLSTRFNNHKMRSGGPGLE